MGRRAAEAMGVLLALASVLCLATVPLAGGRLRALADLELRGVGFLLAGLALQVVVIEIVPDAPQPVGAVAHVVSYGLIGVTFWRSRSLPFLWLIGIGGALNGLAIAANGGVMPARADALATAGLDATGDGFENSALVAHPHLGSLGDVLAVPGVNVFSAGDVLIVAGLALLLHVWCGSRLISSAHDLGGRARGAAPARGAGVPDGRRGAGRAPALQRTADRPRAHHAAG